MPVVGEHECVEFGVLDHCLQFRVLAECASEREVEEVIDRGDARVQAGGGNIEPESDRSDRQRTQAATIQQRGGCVGHLLHVNGACPLYWLAVLPVAHTPILSALC